MYALAVPIYTDGSNSGEGLGCGPDFPDFYVFISLPVVASILIEETCDIFLALSRILFHESNNFVIYSDSRNARQALGSLYTRNSLVLKIRSVETFPRSIDFLFPEVSRLGSFLAPSP